jgi:mRNA interferase YafQ
VYQIQATNKFKKDVKLCVKRGLDVTLLTIALKILELDGGLPPKYKPHVLVGNNKGLWECHIKPDWLLIWEKRGIRKLNYSSQNWDSLRFV